jgi:hypothetical protein
MIDKNHICQLVSDGKDIYVVHDGVRIAKLAHPNTPQARTWIPLEPGWSVQGGPSGELDVSYDPSAQELN